MSPSTTVVTLLAQIDATLSAAAANQDLPIHAIDESLRPLRDGRPIIQTAISLNQAPLAAVDGSVFQSDELEVGKVWEERCKSALEISISMSVTDGRLAAAVEYAQELFDKRTIERACDWWTTLFSAMVKTQSSKVSRLPILTDANKQSVIREFNDGSFSCTQSRRIDGHIRELCGAGTRCSSCSGRS